MKISYKPEIDGLRALAVLSVIIYHAQINLFDNFLLQGGYLGVDIFFVISGYLITKIIIIELETTNNFSFRYFYERRFRRIIPPLLTVIVATFALSWFFLNPSQLVELAKSTIFSILFSSNFFFYLTEINYWAQNNLLTEPLLHTWSLAVEEQYYIFFPAICFLIYRYLKKYFLIFLIVIFLLSLLSTVYYSTENNNSFNFYMLHSRGWELIAGSFLCYIEIYKNKTSYKLKISNLLSLLGLIMVFVSIIYFEEKTSHPSVFTTVPVFGVCLVIFFANDKTFVNKILSKSIFVKIGLISYSLYLWHYPIFTMAKLSDNFMLNSNKLIAIGLTFLFSIISYLFIEKPSRNKKNNFKYVFFIFLIVSVVMVVFSNITINKQGFYKRDKFVNNLGIRIGDYVMDKNYYIVNHHGKFVNNYIPDNFENSPKNNKKILVVGNSRAVDLFHTLHVNKNLFLEYSFNYAKKIKNRNLRDEMKCFYLFLSSDNLDCKKDTAYYMRNVIDQFNKADTIFLASAWTSVEIDYLEKIISILKRKGKDVYIANFPPKLDLYTFHAINSFDKFVYDNGRLPNINETFFLEKQLFKNLINNKSLFPKTEITVINEKLEIIAKKFNVSFFKNENFQCDKSLKKCHLMTPDSHKIYFDDIHFTNEGAKFFGKLIYEKNWLTK
jgi:peptidoglycan/LPS O-acetylase OafA/YrhL